MTRYRRVSVRVWTDSFFSSLDDDGKLVWLYLLTSSQTTPFGLYRLSFDQASYDLGWQRSRFASAIDAIVSKGAPNAIRYDASRGLVFLPKWIAYNPPINPNVVKSWARQLAELPEDTPLRYDWLCIMEEHMTGKGFQEAFWDAFEGTTGKQQDQDQEQERGGARRRPAFKFNYDSGSWNRAPVDAEYRVWTAAYPDINPKREFLKATAFLVSNPGHVKSKFGKFLNNWMNKAQQIYERDNGGRA